MQFNEGESTMYQAKWNDKTFGITQKNLNVMFEGVLSNVIFDNKKHHKLFHLFVLKVTPLKNPIFLYRGKVIYTTKKEFSLNGEVACIKK